MTEHLDARSRSIGLRRSHRLEEKLGVALDAMKAIHRGPDQSQDEDDSALADGSRLQAVGNWESEGGASS